MTDLEIYEALVAAVKIADLPGDNVSSTVLDEVGRHQPRSQNRAGCSDKWRECPVIVHYARVFEVPVPA